MLITAKYRIIIATLLIVVSVIETALAGYELFIINEALIITQFGLGSTLLGIGLIKKNERPAK